MPIKFLAQSFRDETKELISIGISSWQEIKELKEDDLIKIVQQGRSTIRNLKKLKSIAELVCELGLRPEEAALLLHSGLGTISALASSTPEKLIRQTGRLKRQLKSPTPSNPNFPKAELWISRAKARQLKN